MPYELCDLVVDRVDLVDDGANSAAFIELYKRKENKESMNFDEILAKMKPEHAQVIQAEVDKARGEAQTAANDLASANEALAKANGELEVLKSSECVCKEDTGTDDKGMCKACGKPKKRGGCEKSSSFDETETMKAMPANVREMFEKMRQQRDAAEEQVRKNNEEKLQATAIAKAAELKAIPCEHDKLVGIVKGCSDEVYELLKAANKAIEDSLLTEVGKNAGNGADTHSHNDSAWDKLEAKAAEIAKRDSVTVEKAMSTAISENPDIYRDYLQEV